MRAQAAPSCVHARQPLDPARRNTRNAWRAKPLFLLVFASRKTIRDALLDSLIRLA